MLFQEKIIKAFNLKVNEWDKELKLEELIPNYMYIKEKVINDCNNIYENAEIEQKDLDLLKSNRRKTKNRWIKAEMKNGMNRKKMKDLTEWSDIDIPLIKFPFIASKNSKSLTSAIKNDMTIELYKLIINLDKIPDYESIQKEKREISRVSNMLTSIPYNTSNTTGGFEGIGKILSSIDKKTSYTETSIKTDKYTFVIDYNDDEPRTRLELTSPANLKKALNRINQVINATDRKIFNYIISRRGAGFLNTGIITIPVVDIIKNVFGSFGEENYNILKASLFKMEKIKGVIGNSKTYTGVGLIFNQSIVKDQGVYMLVAEIHSYMRDEIIKQHTINLYKDIIDTCPDDDSELLLYFLQRKRLGLILLNNPLTITVNYYDYFSEVLFFTNKRKDRNIARLIKGLEFVQNTKSVLNYFQRKKDNITLCFKEMSENELADLNYSDIFDEKFAEFRSKLIDEPKHDVIE